MDDFDDVVIIYSCLLALVEDMGGIATVSKSAILEIAESKGKHIGMFIDEKDNILLEVIDNDKD